MPPSSRRSCRAWVPFVGRGRALSDEQWAVIGPLMPRVLGRSRPWRDHRQVVEGIVYRYRTGVAWPDLPEHRAGSNHKNQKWSEPDDHALGRSRGGLSTKVHAAVDGRGSPLAFLVSPGQDGDAPMCVPLLNAIRVPRIGAGRPRTTPEAARPGDPVRQVRPHLPGPRSRSAQSCAG